MQSEHSVFSLPIIALMKNPSAVCIYYVWKILREPPCLFMVCHTKGPFFNYVDKTLSVNDHLPTPHSHLWHWWKISFLHTVDIFFVTDVTHSWASAGSVTVCFCVSPWFFIQITNFSKLPMPETEPDYKASTLPLSSTPRGIQTYQWYFQYDQPTLSWQRSRIMTP